MKLIRWPCARSAMRPSRTSSHMGFLAKLSSVKKKPASPSFSQTSFTRFTIEAGVR